MNKLVKRVTTDILNEDGTIKETTIKYIYDKEEAEDKFEEEAEDRLEEEADYSLEIMREVLFHIFGDDTPISKADMKASGINISDIYTAVRLIQGMSLEDRYDEFRYNDSREVPFEGLDMVVLTLSIAERIASTRKIGGL